MTHIACERSVGRWDSYFDRTCTRGCSALLTEALKHVSSRDHAIDLGAGAMNDSVQMLQMEGFEKVEAVDASDASIPYAQAVRAEFGRRFDFWNVRFCDFPFETETADLVHANFSLPYHGAVGFNDLLTVILESVKVGGVFSAILFGNEDGWVKTKPDLAFHSRTEVEHMFSDFEFVIPVREYHLDGHLVGGENTPAERTPKFWHYFQIVVRRTQPVL